MRVVDFIHLNKHTAYIAGTGSGVVSVGGVPGSRKVYALDAKTLNVVKTAVSSDDGQYLIPHLDPAKRYLIMARDYQGEYEPYCYDNVAPATDLILDEQQALWQQMANQASQA